MFSYLHGVEGFQMISLCLPGVCLVMLSAFKCGPTSRVPTEIISNQATKQYGLYYTSTSRWDLLIPCFQTQWCGDWAFHLNRELRGAYFDSDGIVSRISLWAVSRSGWSSWRRSHWRLALLYEEISWVLTSSYSRVMGLIDKNNTYMKMRHIRCNGINYF